MTSVKDKIPPNRETSVPKYGLKVRLNHTYPEDRSQDFVPSIRQIWAILPLVLRYLRLCSCFLILRLSLQIYMVLHRAQNHGKVHCYGLLENHKVKANIR
jgi:hypothetical protein